jgi:hypothetical protein
VRDIIDDALGWGGVGLLLLARSSSGWYFGKLFRQTARQNGTAKRHRKTVRQKRTAKHRKRRGKMA